MPHSSSSHLSRFDPHPPPTPFALPPPPVSPSPARARAAQAVQQRPQRVAASALALCQGVAVRKGTHAEGGPRGNGPLLVGLKTAPCARKRRRACGQGRNALRGREGGGGGGFKIRHVDASFVFSWLERVVASCRRRDVSRAFWFSRRDSQSLGIRACRVVCQ